MTKQNDAEKYLTITEFAENNGLSRSVVYKYLESGKIASEAVLDGRPLRIRADALEWRPEKPVTVEKVERSPVQESPRNNEFQLKILEEMRQGRQEQSIERETYREQLKQKDRQLAESERQRAEDRENYAKQLQEKDRQIEELTRQLRESSGHLQRMNEQFGKLTDQAQQLHMASMQQKQIMTVDPTDALGQEAEKKVVDEHLQNRETNEEQIRKDAEKEILEELKTVLTPHIEALDRGDRLYFAKEYEYPTVKNIINLPEKFKICERLYQSAIGAAYTFGKKRGWIEGWQSKKFGANFEKKRTEFFEYCNQGVVNVEQAKKYSKVRKKGLTDMDMLLADTARVDTVEINEELNKSRHL